MSYKAALQENPVDVGEVLETGEPYSPSPVEAAVIREITERDKRAKSATCNWRIQMQTDVQKRFGEWTSPNDKTELGAMYRNIVGRRIKKWAQFVVDLVCPDPVGYNHITVVSETKGTRIDEGLDISAAIGSTRRARIAEIALTQATRDNLRSIRFRQRLFDALMDVGTFGFAVATPDYYNETVKDLVEYEDPFGDFVEEESLRTVESGFKVRRVDPRNFFAGSIEMDRGIEDLEWWTEYDVALPRDVQKRRVVKLPSGEISGCWYNTKCIKDADSILLHRVYYDDLDTGILDTPLAGSTFATAQLEYGYRICRYIGSFGAGDVKVDNAAPNRTEWRSFLRRFGNDPATCRTARWWIAEIVYGGMSANPGGGVLVRFEPYPIFDGEKCAYVMSRFDKYPGIFPGQSQFKCVGGDEELANIYSRLFARQVLMGARPPAIFDPYAIDTTFLAANNQTVPLGPGKIIPVNSSRTPNMDPIKFLNPGVSESISHALTGVQSMTSDIDEALGVTGLQLGEVEARVTATNVAAAQQNAFSSIRSDAIAFEQDFSGPLVGLILEATIEAAEEGGLSYKMATYQEAVDAADTDDRLGEIVANYDRETVERLLPIHLEVSGDVRRGDYSVEVISNAASGGRDTLSAALGEFMKAASELNAKLPGQFDEKDILLDWAKSLGIIRPERYQASQQNADSAVLLHMLAQQMQAIGAGGSGAAPKGEASQPREAAPSAPEALVAGGGM